jgi:hypothetical protein
MREIPLHGPAVEVGAARDFLQVSGALMEQAAISAEQRVGLERPTGHRLGDLRDAR